MRVPYRLTALSWPYFLLAQSYSDPFVDSLTAAIELRLAGMPPDPNDLDWLVDHSFWLWILVLPFVDWMMRKSQSFSKHLVISWIVVVCLYCVFLIDAGEERRGGLVAHDFGILFKHFIAVGSGYFVMLWLWSRVKRQPS